MNLLVQLKYLFQVANVCLFRYENNFLNPRIVPFMKNHAIYLGFVFKEMPAVIRSLSRKTWSPLDTRFDTNIISASATAIKKGQSTQVLFTDFTVNENLPIDNELNEYDKLELQQKATVTVMFFMSLRSRETTFYG